MKIMIVTVIITVLLVESYDDSVAFTHGFMGHQRIDKIAGYSPAYA